MKKQKLLTLFILIMVLTLQSVKAQTETDDQLTEITASNAHLVQLMGISEVYRDSTVGVAWSPSGETIAVIERGEGITGTLRLYDINTFIVPTGRVPSELVSSTSIDIRKLTNGIAYTPNGESIVAGDGNGNIFLIHNTTLDQSQEFETDLESISSISISPDGNFVAAGGSNGVIGILDITTGKVILELDSDDPEASIFFLEYSPDGSTLLSKYLYGAMIWDTETGDPLKELGSSKLITATSAEFSSDGSLVVVGGFDGTIGTFDVRSGTLLNITSTPIETPFAFTQSQDDTLIAIGGWDGILALVNAATGEVITNFPGHEDLVRDAKFSPDGKMLATVGADGFVKLWGIPAGN